MKLLPFCFERVTEAAVKDALSQPRQSHRLTLEDVMARFRRLEKLWEHLSQIAVLSERADLNEELLDLLEERAIMFNIEWRDAFGAQPMHCTVLLTYTCRRARLHAQDTPTPAPRRLSSLLWTPALHVGVCI